MTSEKDWERIKGEPKVKNWAAALSDNTCEMLDIKVLNTLCKPSGELLFALLSADVKSPDMFRIPPYIFIRGDACIIVPEVVNIDSGENRFLTVIQRRIAWGGESIEFPAGMLDRNVDHPEVTALKELEEETGLVIHADSLFSLHDKPLYSSPGASDEAIHYFGCRILLTNTQWLALDGRLEGDALEGEVTKVRLLTEQEIESGTRSLQVMLGLRLFRESQKADDFQRG